MADLKSLSPQALAAAMRGGTENWGQWGSSDDHIGYVEAIEPEHRTRHICRCGCRKNKTHRFACNGVTLATGCELSMRRWAKAVEARRAAAPAPQGERP